MNSYWPLFSEGSSTQFKTKRALSALYPGIYASLKISNPCLTVVKYLISGSFWRQLLFSLPINITVTHAHTHTPRA